jgi:hypothetical protein
MQGIRWAWVRHGHWACEQHVSVSVYCIAVQLHTLELQTNIVDSRAVNKIVFSRVVGPSRVVFSPYGSRTARGARRASAVPRRPRARGRRATPKTAGAARYTRHVHL